MEALSLEAIEDAVETAFNKLSPRGKSVLFHSTVAPISPMHSTTSRPYRCGEAGNGTLFVFLGELADLLSGWLAVGGTRPECRRQQRATVYLERR